MASVRHLVTPPGKPPVEFFAPEGASDAQLQQLASRALASSFPGETFVTPVLDAATRKGLERKPRKLTQDEILARQGELTSRDPSLRERDIEGLTSVLSGLGMGDRAMNKATDFVNDIYDWTPVGSVEALNEVGVDAAGGRYLDAFGNAVMAGVDLIPEIGPAAGAGISALATFAGPMAKNANLDMMRRAEQMLAQGADKAQVIDETGWWRGPDGKMRFEISDQASRIIGKPKNPQRQADAAARRRAKELGYPNHNEIPWTKFEDIRDVDRAGTEAYQRYQQGTPLNEVFSHPELEAAYDLSNIKVRPLPKDARKGTKGAYNAETNTVYLAPGLSPEEARSVIIHEIGGHNTQKIEGFSGGGSLSPDLRMESGATYQKAIENRDLIQRMIDNSKTPEERAFYEKQMPAMMEAIDTASMFEGYQRLGGEVEARNLQTRLDPEQAGKYPWETQDFPDEEQIHAFPGDGQQLSLDPPGTTPTANVLTGATPKSAGIKGGRQAAMTKVWEGVDNLDDALKIANAGGHHRLDASGNLMGSPDVKPEDLGTWRAGLDALLQRAGGRGLGWYQGVRDLTTEIASTPGLQGTFSRVGGVYSPQAAPVAETGFNLAHHNRRVLTGEPQTVTTGQRAKAAEQAYGAVDPETGYINLTPEKISLGEKTEPYSVLKDPTRDWGWTAPADLWMGRAFGYKPDKGQKAFDRAFQPNEHAFLKGEMALALERARAAGTLPPDATVANVQEVMWVQKRFEDYMAENPGATIEEAEKYAKEAIGEGVERHTAALSREFTPGGGLGELEQLGADPAANARFAAGMEAAGGGRNSVFDAMQMYQRPTVNALGFWNDPVHGLQTNPAFVDRPLVSFRPEPVLMEKGKYAGTMQPKGPAMDAESRNAMMVAGRLFGLENVQHGVGANVFIPQVSTHAPQQLNGAFYPPARRAEAIEAATKAGLDVVDQGNGGIYVTSFADDTAGAAKKVKAFTDANPGGELGRYDTNYASSGLSEWDEDFNLVPRPHGEGIATKELLEATGSIPGLEKRLEHSAYPGQVAERNEERASWAKELATSLRPDVQKLRDLLAQGGPAAVRRYVDKHGYKGLPVWAGALLGGGLLVSQQQDQGAASYPQGI